MIFTVEDGCFAYHKDRPLLHNISFSVASGELAAVLGPNGAGKTTLLRCMMGFLPWQSGRSTLNGVDIRTMGNRLLWQKVAYVPQARGVVSSYTVEDMVLLGRSSRFGLFAQPQKEDKQAALSAMERLNIIALRGRSCAELSGGELQMVLIARALAAGPELLILDEPESNLDFKNQLIILDTMSELVDSGLACLFNTHYPTHALQRADKALIIDKQGKYVFGRAPRVITEENIAAAFGVESVIGEIETKHNVYRNVLPVQVLQKKVENKSKIALQEDSGKDSDMETRLAIIGIIIEDRSSAERINDLLSQHGKYIIGRMGMPYEKKGLSIISVIIDAPEDIISTLAGKLGQLSGVSVKATYSKR